MLQPESYILKSNDINKKIVYNKNNKNKEEKKGSGIDITLTYFVFIAISTVKQMILLHSAEYK